MMHDQKHFNPNARGFHAAYRANEANHCPGCGKSHWIIGSITAECAFCTTALPLVAEIMSGSARPVFQRRHSEPAARGRFTINGRPA